jgi:hypothetical protein
MYILIALSASRPEDKGEGTSMKLRIHIIVIIKCVNGRDQDTRKQESLG